MIVSRIRDDLARPRRARRPRPAHVALRRPRAGDRTRHRGRPLDGAARGLRGRRRRRLPRVARAPRCPARDDPVAPGPRRVRPRVRVRGRRPRPPALRGRDRVVALREDVLRLPGRDLLEDDGRHGRRGVRPAVRRAPGARRGVPVLPPGRPAARRARRRAHRRGRARDPGPRSRRRGHLRPARRRRRTALLARRAPVGAPRRGRRCDGRSTSSRSGRPPATRARSCCAPAPTTTRSSSRSPSGCIRSSAGS